MNKQGKIVPVMRICVHCPHFYGQDEQLYNDDGSRTDEEDGGEGDFCWYCKHTTGSMFVGDPRIPPERDDYVQVNEDTVPDDCPYTIEHLYSQEHATELWKDMLPLLKKWL